MASDFFLKIGDLKAESQDDKFKEWIDVLAWSWGASQPGDMHGGGGGGAGKVNVQDFSFTKKMDISSTKTLLALCNGKHFGKVEFKARKAGEKPFIYLEYTFDEAILTSYSTGGSGGEETITENISIQFRAFKMKYSQQSKTGGNAASDEIKYDIAKNKGS